MYQTWKAGNEHERLAVWRPPGQARGHRQTPLTFENVLPLARDLASSVTALYSTFQLAACELHGGEYEQCAAPLADALQDALTGLCGGVNAKTHKEAVSYAQ